MTAKIPATIVTGFLGAGKTTLIRHLLANAGGRRLALIINEFGDVGVDGEILRACGVETCPEENIVELANGCICCTVADDFAPAIDGAAGARADARPHRHRDLGPRAAEAAGQGVRLAGAARQAHGRRRHRGGRRRRGRRKGASPTIRARSPQQRAPTRRSTTTIRSRRSTRTSSLCADLVVLNKADLARREAARARVRGDRWRSVPRAVKIARDARGRGRRRRAARPRRRRRGRSRRAALASRRGGRSTTTTISTLSSWRSRPAAIADALIERSPTSTRAHDILRIKGFRRGRRQADAAAGAGRRRRAFRRDFDRPWGAGEARRGRLVVIGEKGVDRAADRRGAGGALTHMHLLRPRSAIGLLDETVEAVDLDQTPADIVVLSFSDSDLCAAGAPAYDAELDQQPKPDAALRSARCDIRSRSISISRRCARRRSLWSCACSAASTIGATASMNWRRRRAAQGFKLAHACRATGCDDARLDGPRPLPVAGPAPHLALFRRGRPGQYARAASPSPRVA